MSGNTRLRATPVMALAALILATLACDTPGAPATAPNNFPPTATRALPGTSLPPVDGATGTAAPTFTSPPGDIAQVTRIVDGDTFKATQDGVEVTVRYIGINTPEVDEPCYEEATAANQGMIAGQTVTMVRDVSDTDQYGRLLRYVYAGGLMVNAQLVGQGWAEAVKYPPDLGHADEFHSLAVRARGANLGCWPTGIFGPPAEVVATIGPSVTPGGPTSTPGGIAPCDCDYNKYNCSSFASRAEAQVCYDYCVAQGAGDIHLMDGDLNGLACEAFP